MSLKKLLLLIIVLFATTISRSQIITTVAGNGTYGYSGNGGPATSAQLAWEIGLATDNAGNFYIADHDNDVVRKVNSAGIISDYAGNHSLGYSGDGGPATSAQIYHPAWMTMDNAGNLYFTDQNSEIIRKVTPAGIITTITGFLPAGYSGDGGPLIAAAFRSIAGIAFDNAGNMYISDNGNHVIRKVNTSGIITTIAGNGTPGSAGDGGLATSAQLGNPYKVIFDNAGNMYIPDNGNQKIRKVDPAGIITTFAGTGVLGYSGDGGPASAAQFRFPWSIDIDNAGNIYVADAGNEVIRKINTAGIITTFAGNGNSGYSGDGGPATAAEMSDICNVAVDNAGNVLITNRTPYYVVRKVNNCLTALISQQPANVTICNPGPATFSIIANSFTSLQWQVNTGSGWNNVTDDVNYSGSTTANLNIATATAAMNSYQYRCAAVNGCATIYSAAVLLTVTAPITPAVTINASATNICAAVNVVFTATPSNAGPSPLYQWIKNGMNVGTSQNYNDNALNNGDVISCILTSTSTCVTGNTATSNSITMTVTPLVTPLVTIVASANNICYGTPITFTSTIVNGGSAPAYTWFKNGVNLFLNSPTYTDNALNNGDHIMCAFRSSIACVTSEIGVSNDIQMNITPLATPGVAITATNSSICRGSSVSFTATPVNGGPSPVYQWKKNNIPIGTGGSVYTGIAIANGDVFTCELTSNAGCLTTPSANSNAVTITLLPDPAVSLDHTNSLCTGDSRLLNAGNFPSYVWNDGSTAQTLLINNTGTYYVTVTASNGCKGSDTTRITNLLPLPSGFAPPDSSICSYGTLLLKAQPGYNNYSWNTGSIASSITLTQPGVYWLQVTDNNNCRATDTILVLPKECMKGFYIPNAFTPNNDGKNDLFRPLLFGNVKQYSFTVYNRWGNVVFTTKDPQKGWDGKFGGREQDTNVFVWSCIYQFEGEEVKREKGSVVIIR